MLHGRAKASAVRALAAREGLDLRRCTAYSDSVNDLPMLTTVGTPVAVNPDGELRDIARQRNWLIQDFRVTGRRSSGSACRRCCSAWCSVRSPSPGWRYVAGRGATERADGPAGRPKTLPGHPDDGNGTQPAGRAVAGPAADQDQREVARLPAGRAAAVGGRDGRPARRHRSTAALSAALEAGDTGYPMGDEYGPALAAFAARRWGWDVAVERTSVVADVMNGIVEVLRLVTGPGDPWWSPRRCTRRSTRSSSTTAGASSRRRWAPTAGSTSTVLAGTFARRHPRRWSGGVPAVQPAQPDRRRAHARPSWPRSPSSPDGTACGW